MPSATLHQVAEDRLEVVVERHEFVEFDTELNCQRSDPATKEVDVSSIEHQLIFDDAHAFGHAAFQNGRAETTGLISADTNAMRSIVHQVAQRVIIPGCRETALSDHDDVGAETGNLIQHMA